MRNQVEEFEEYLTEFQPIGPRPLPDSRREQRVWRPRIAAAATLTIVMGGSLWLVRKEENPKRIAFTKADTVVPKEDLVTQDFPLVGLRKLALQDPRALDARLSDVSQNILPDFQTSNSTLMVLAKE